MDKAVKFIIICFIALMLVGCAGTSKGIVLQAESTDLINTDPEVAIDYIEIVKKEENEGVVTEMNSGLITPKPHLNGIKLYTYLKEVYGKKILSGQQAQWDNDAEIKIIKEITGKEPAIRGFDFMDYSPSRTARGAKARDTDAAIEWWKSGGVVTFCWHWNAPMDLIDEGPDKYWHSGFYTKATTFDLAKALENKESEQYKGLISDIDVIAVELKKLEQAGVPVLWRPLHEASGAWFWWGAKGPEPCKELWIIMYDRLVNHHGLTNLIWVWNGQKKDWYPGDEYVDMIGEDIYPPERDYSSQKQRFVNASGYTEEQKIIALTENGVIPDPDQLIEDNIPWAWFCTWRGTFVINSNGSYNEQYTEKNMLIKTYNHEYVITKDELPSFLE